MIINVASLAGMKFGDSIVASPLLVGMVGQDSTATTIKFMGISGKYRNYTLLFFGIVVSTFQVYEAGMDTYVEWL
jgi:hypothetical protein